MIREPASLRPTLLFTRSLRRLAWLLLQVEIGRVKTGNLLEMLPVADRDDLTLPRDQPLPAEMLNRAVGVHQREPERVAQFLLRERKLKAAVRRQTDSLEAEKQLAEQVRQLTRSGPASHPDQPFAMGSPRQSTC
jgi:hypothetical protein